MGAMNILYSPKIARIRAREVLDSRGYPTVETEVMLEDGTRAMASVPSGASTGKREAVELRDGDLMRYYGKGVLNAVMNIEDKIAPALIGKKATHQHHIDALLCQLDCTDNKAIIGANATLAVSLACARAAAMHYHEKLFRYLGGCHAHRMPVPFMNVINGGAHSDAPIDIQEIMIVPAGMCCFKEALRCGSEIFHALGMELRQQGLSTAVGDEGGYAPNFSSTESALDTLMLAIEKAGYRAGEDVYLAMDVASSEFYEEEKHLYHMRKSTGKRLNLKELGTFYKELLAKYPIISIEDSCAEDDWEGWKRLTEKLGNRCQIVGDDLFVTNMMLLERGMSDDCANAILIKPNQIGTLTETMHCTNKALLNGYGAMISHRSGETCDCFIADLSVATNAGQIKTGSLSRGERLAKYNQLLRIEAHLGKAATFGSEQLHQFLS